VYNEYLLLQSDLPNMTWHDVQKRLRDVQREHQICIHKTDLTALGMTFQTFLCFAQCWKSLFDSWLILYLDVEFVEHFCLIVLVIYF
jgi:hypothetical protein